MQKCNNEEHGIKVWDDAGGTNDGAPGQTHEPVCDIIGLAAIFPPTTSEKTIPMCGLNIGWVLHDATRKLRESFTEFGDALCLHFEPALL